MTDLKPFSETIDVQPFPGGKGMAPDQRAKNLDPEKDDGTTVNEDKSFKEFWDEVQRVGEKLGVPGARVVMALAQRQKGLEEGSDEDARICSEFKKVDRDVEQYLVGGLIKRGWGEDPTDIPLPREWGEVPIEKLTSTQKKDMAMKLAAKIAKKRGLKIVPNLLYKWTLHRIPLIAAGVTIAELVRKGVKEFK